MFREINIQYFSLDLSEFDIPEMAAILALVAVIAHDKYRTLRDIIGAQLFPDWITPFQFPIVDKSPPRVID